MIESRNEPALLDDGSTEPESALAALAAAAVSGVAPVGPEQRLRPAITLRGVLPLELEHRQLARDAPAQFHRLFRTLPWFDHSVTGEASRPGYQAGPGRVWPAAAPNPSPEVPELA